MQPATLLQLMGPSTRNRIKCEGVTGPSAREYHHASRQPMGVGRHTRVPRMEAEQNILLHQCLSKAPWVLSLLDQ